MENTGKRNPEKHLQPATRAVFCIGIPEGFTSVSMLIEAIEAFVASRNQNASRFEWTKAEVHQQMERLLLSFT